MIFISQPTFLPWIGYFDLIDQSDFFIILDDAKFEKQSWQQRNQFKTQNGFELFTIPVLSNNQGLINEILIFNSKKIKNKFINFLNTNYSKAKYFEKYSPLFKELFIKCVETKSLCYLNINLIELCLQILGIKKKIIYSSELKIKKKKSEKLIEICKHNNQNDYLSTIGAKEYLLEDKQKFLDEGINVYIHNYECLKYRQLHEPFKDNLSILDLILNEGNNSMDVIRSGRKKNIKLI